MGQWLRVVAALPEDLHLVSGIHVWRSLIQLYVATAPGSLMSCYPRVPICTWHVNTQIAIKNNSLKVHCILTDIIYGISFPLYLWLFSILRRRSNMQIRNFSSAFYLQIITFTVLLVSQSVSCLHFPVCSVNRKCFQYISI